MPFDTKLGHGTCEIRQITRGCTQCTSMFDKPWYTGVPPHQQQRYQSIIDFTHSPVLGSFNNWNIVQLSHKQTSSKDIDKGNQVVIDGTNDNMAVLVQTVKYDDIKQQILPQWSTT